MNHIIPPRGGPKKPPPTLKCPTHGLQPVAIVCPHCAKSMIQSNETMRASNAALSAALTEAPEQLRRAAGAMEEQKARADWLADGMRNIHKATHIQYCKMMGLPEHEHHAACEYVQYYLSGPYPGQTPDDPAHPGIPGDFGVDLFATELTEEGGHGN